MWRKTAIHELFKWIPKSSEALQLAAGSIAAEGRTIETTAIDLGSVALPMEETAPALDALTEQLEIVQPVGGYPDVVVTPAGCTHPDIPPSRLEGLALGHRIVCPACGEELPPAVAQ